MQTTLDTKIHLIEGNHPDLKALMSPLWSGTVRVFLAANDFWHQKDIDRLLFDTSDHGVHRRGIGTARPLTILSDEGLDMMVRQMVEYEGRDRTTVIPPKQD